MDRLLSADYIFFYIKRVFAQIPQLSQVTKNAYFEQIAQITDIAHMAPSAHIAQISQFSF